VAGARGLIAGPVCPKVFGCTERVTVVAEEGPAAYRGRNSIHKQWFLCVHVSSALRRHRQHTRSKWHTTRLLVTMIIIIITTIIVVIIIIIIYVSPTCSCRFIARKMFLLLIHNAHIHVAFPFDDDLYTCNNKYIHIPTLTEYRSNNTSLHG
jgi:hypothetical protein